LALAGYLSLLTENKRSGRCQRYGKMLSSAELTPKIPQLCGGNGCFLGGGAVGSTGCQLIVAAQVIHTAGARS